MRALCIAAAVTAAAAAKPPQPPNVGGNITIPNNYLDRYVRSHCFRLQLSMSRQVDSSYVVRCVANICVRACLCVGWTDVPLQSIPCVLPSMPSRQPRRRHMLQQRNTEVCAECMLILCTLLHEPHICRQLCAFVTAAGLRACGRCVLRGWGRTFSCWRRHTRRGCSVTVDQWTSDRSSLSPHITSACCLFRMRAICKLCRLWRIESVCST